MLHPQPPSTKPPPINGVEGGVIMAKLENATAKFVPTLLTAMAQLTGTNGQSCPRTCDMEITVRSQSATFHNR